MPELTRRPDNDPHQQGWFVYFGDIRIGHIGLRAGVPKDVDQWGWCCGFHPGCDPGEYAHGSAPTFEEARSQFEAAWKNLAPKKGPAHFEMWRYQRDFTTWKYRMWAEGCLMPTQTKDDRSKCFCGAEITNASAGDHIRQAHRGLGDRK